MHSATVFYRGSANHICVISDNNYLFLSAKHFEKNYNNNNTNNNNDNTMKILISLYLTNTKKKKKVYHLITYSIVMSKHKLHVIADPHTTKHTDELILTSG